MRDTVVGAEFVHQVPATDTGPSLQAILGIVDAGMDDLAMAGTDTGADGVRGLKHDDLAPGAGKGAGDGQADDPGADDRAIDILCHRPYPIAGGVWRTPQQRVKAARAGPALTKN